MTTDGLAIDAVFTRSQRAAADAALVERLGAYAGGRELRLDRGLYVEREAMGHLREALAREARVAVVGDAGHGKTCLLWRVHDELSARALPLFVPATRLRARPGRPDPGRELLDVLDRLGSHPVVVLLDTVDVLLHDENDREDLIEILDAVTARGSSWVVTCRPQEAVLLRDVIDEFVQLGPYSADELPQAIRVHAHAVAQPHAARTADEVTAGILASLEDGYALRKLCEIPLTLRMLFTVYFPEPLPADVGVFQLYRRFWDLRVRSDHRSELPNLLSHDDDFSAESGTLALCMLADGMPSASAAACRDRLAAAGLRTSALETLRNRAVVDVEDGEVAFFHQTFFEHAAAHGAIELLGQDGLLALVRRAVDAPTDLLSRPVVEQALILAFDRPDLAGAAHRGWAELAKHPEATVRLSAVVVYGYAPQEFPGAAAVLAAMVDQGDETTILHVVQVGQEIPARRDPTGFLAILGQAWSRGTHRVRMAILEVLARFAVRAPKAVVAFLDRFRIPEEVDSAIDPSELRLNVVLRALLPRIDPATRLRLVEAAVRGYVAAVRRLGRVEDLIERVLVPLVEGGDQTGWAERIEAILPTGDHSRSDSGVNRSWGRLLAAERPGDEGVGHVLAELAERADGPELRRRLHALVALLRSGEEASWATAWAAFPPRDAGACAAFCDVLWKELLDGTAPVDPRRVALLGWIASLLEQRDDRAAQLLVEALRDSRVDPRSLARACDRPGLASQALWLGRLGFLLGRAAAGGHPGAVASLARVVANPGSVPPAVLDRAAFELADPYLGAGASPLDALRIAMAALAPGLVRGVLERVPPTELLGLRDELAAFPDLCLVPYRQAAAREVPQLTAALAERGIAGWPALEVVDRALRTRDAPTRREWGVLISRGARAGAWPAAEATRRLEALAVDQHPDVADTSLDLAVMLARSLPFDAAVADRLVTLAVRAPGRVERATLAGFIVEWTGDVDPGHAVRLFRALVTAPTTVALRPGSLRKLAARLRKPAALLFRRLPPVEATGLLALVPGLPPMLGRVLVDAASRAGMAGVRATCEALMVDARVAPDLKEVLRRHLKGRTAQSRHEWPELGRLLGRLAPGTSAPPQCEGIMGTGNSAAYKEPMTRHDVAVVDFLAQFYGKHAQMSAHWVSCGGSESELPEHGDPVANWTPLWRMSGAGANVRQEQLVLRALARYPGNRTLLEWCCQRARPDLAAALRVVMANIEATGATIGPLEVASIVESALEALPDVTADLVELETAAVAAADPVAPSTRTRLRMILDRAADTARTGAIGAWKATVEAAVKALVTAILAQGGSA